MKTLKNKMAFVLFAALIAGFAIPLLIGVTEPDEVRAESIETNIVYDVSVQTNIQERGLFANLSVSLNGGTATVTAIARNDFTLFPSTIQVRIELYSSDTYQNRCSSMTLVSSNSTADLNIFETVEASASTGGVQKYWRGRMEYKFDNNDWVSQETPTALYSADGEFIQ